VQSYAGATHHFRLPERVATAMRRHDATPFMSLLTAFAVVVGRWAGRTEFAIGTPVAGRTDVDVEPLIGFFVNTLALRIDLSGDPTFEELFGRVREIALDAHDHADLPFEHLVECLAAAHPGHGPLVQVAFVLQNATSPWTSPAFEVRGPGRHRHLEAHLMLSVVDGDDGARRSSTGPTCSIRHGSSGSTGGARRSSARPPART
jgi:non-ribosomal peptide synthetase component F